MDKFLIRTPRSPQTVLREQKEEPRKVQSSLFSLKGVVVVEDLVKAKNLLRDEDVDPERKVKVLRQLGEKQPSTELLETTGIGRTVRRLSKEAEGEVKKVATEVYITWKQAVEKRVELSHNKIEVACDKVRENFSLHTTRFFLPLEVHSSLQILMNKVMHRQIDTRTVFFLYYFPYYYNEERKQRGCSLPRIIAQFWKDNEVVGRFHWMSDPFQLKREQLP